MEALWTLGPSSVREIQEALPSAARPAYTTVQTMVYRLEAKKAVRRVKKVGNAHVFEAQVSRAKAHRRRTGAAPSFFGGHAQPAVTDPLSARKQPPTSV